PGGDRGPHRSRGAPAAAAHQIRPGQEVPHLDPQGRSGPSADDQAVVQAHARARRGRGLVDARRRRPRESRTEPSMTGSRYPIERVLARVYELRTEDEAEADGTLQWSSTTCVVVELHCQGVTGFGYTYGHAAVAKVVQSTLAEAVQGADAASPVAAWG